MSARNLLLGLILVIFVSTVALADGGFYGYVEYKNCDCYNQPPYSDHVMIKNQDTGEIHWIRPRCGSNPGYNSVMTFEPGYYKIWVDPSDIYSNCTASFPITVYHGNEWQQVDLRVEGNLPTPDGEGDE